MQSPELAQLEVLARIDELVGRLSHWCETESPWEPLHRCQALVRRLLTRVEGLRIRLEAPLVVALFGGTGTGKSTLVNALVGRECTRTGRERPTTTRPVLVAHPQTELEALGLPLEEFEIVRDDAPLLRDIVLIDCPDPDTTEAETPASNLARLHRLLPHCDVLIYTSTQQKYRSARVGDELGQAANGCRLLFVQTHADLDEDIRADWRRQLAGHYEVPEVFWVDSVRALHEQFAGERPSGDFSRLLDVLTTQLAASQRVQIRRANLVDLIHAALDHCRRHLAGHGPAVEQLEAALEEQRRKLTGEMSRRLTEELLTSRALWERRLIDAVTEIWGFSPFSSVLRFYNGMGNLIASFGLFRARNSAQVALIGALQGARWLRSRRQQHAAETQFERLNAFALEEDLLREAHLIVGGYLRSAQLDPALLQGSSPDSLRHEAQRVEGEFLSDAGRRLDVLIDDLAERNARPAVRWTYESLFLAYLVFVIYRVGRNFFFDSFLHDAPLLPIDFYISAGVFLVLWSAALVMAFCRAMRRGLTARVADLAAELAEGRYAGAQGLFPKLEQSCRDIELARARLEAVAGGTAALRGQVASSTALGARISGGETSVELSGR
jgi:hypothetical protein